ncbi:MAG: hypothetical protein SFT91_01660 [Rickettsiaceae bacterium]|nr:hypothetical protein [Rickettsiaceae bacterium]
MTNKIVLINKKDINNFYKDPAQTFITDIEDHASYEVYFDGSVRAEEIHRFVRAFGQHFEYQVFRTYFGSIQIKQIKPKIDLLQKVADTSLTCAEEIITHAQDHKTQSHSELFVQYLYNQFSEYGFFLPYPDYSGMIGED